MELITILFVVAGVILYNLLLIVPERQSCVVERLGKFQRVLSPGFYFLVPFFDRVAYAHENREQVIDIPSQSCITRDNIQIEVDGIVYLKVMDPYKASYGIRDYRNASINLAQTTMRSEIGKLTLGQTFSERDSLNKKIVKEVDVASDPWGIKVLRYEVKNINPSLHVVQTLEKQMEAERQKRAEITLAEAYKLSTIAISEGKRTSAINISEGEKQKRINEAEGRAQQISLVAGSTAKGMEMIALSIRKPGGEAAVKMRLLEQFIGEVGDLMDSTDISVLPSEMANIKGVFEGVDQVSSQFKGGRA